MTPTVATATVTTSGCTTPELLLPASSGTPRVLEATLPREPLLRAVRLLNRVGVRPGGMTAADLAALTDRRARSPTRSTCGHCSTPKLGTSFACVTGDRRHRHPHCRLLSWRPGRWRGCSGTRVVCRNRRPRRGFIAARRRNNHVNDIGRLQSFFDQQAKLDPMRRSSKLAAGATSVALAVLLLAFFLPHALGIGWRDTVRQIVAIPFWVTLCAWSASGRPAWVFTPYAAPLRCRAFARRALALNLGGSSVANVLPFGGAAGIGINYAMLRSWGYDRIADHRVHDRQQPHCRPSSRCSSPPAGSSPLLHARTSSTSCRTRTPPEPSRSTSPPESCCSRLHPPLPAGPPVAGPPQPHDDRPVLAAVRGRRCARVGEVWPSAVSATR